MPVAIRFTEVPAPGCNNEQYFAGLTGNDNFHGIEPNRRDYLLLSGPLSERWARECTVCCRKSGTPLDLPTNWATSGLSASSNESQQVTLTWWCGWADNYTVYWDNVSFSDNNSRNRIEKVLGSSTNTVCLPAEAALYSRWQRQRNYLLLQSCCRQSKRQ